jgi:hypothetical protein
VSLTDVVKISSKRATQHYESIWTRKKRLLHQHGKQK